MSPDSADRLVFDHVAGRAQHWDSVDSDIGDYVSGVVKRVNTLLGSAGLVGAYLHGSLSQGCFYRGKSDIDLIFVIQDPLNSAARHSVAMELCDLSSARPITGDIEVSVLLSDNTRHFHHPLPYEVHYSSSIRQAILDDSIDFAASFTDMDLAAHCAILHASGVVLAGQPIAGVFGSVPLADFKAAVLDDISWILDGERILDSPFYGVLNLCRYLAHLSNGWEIPMSKDAGATWALASVPAQHCRIVAQARACYHSDEPVESDQRRLDGHDWDIKALIEFRDYVGHRKAALRVLG